MKTLKKAIRRVIHAAGKDRTRENLMSVHFESDTDRTTVVATDGHRMSVAFIPCVGINRTVAASVARNAKTEEELLSGDFRFPDWRQVLPKPAEAVASLTVYRNGVRRAAECLEAVRRADEDLTAAYKDAQDSKVAVSLQAPLRPTSAGGMLKIDGEDLVLTVPSLGYLSEAEFRIRATDVSGGPLPTGINLGYLADALKALPNGPVRIRLYKDYAPMTLEPADESGLEIIMPTRL